MSVEWRQDDASATCSVDQCDRAQVARRLCGKHYQRFRKDQMWVPVDREIDRFDELVDRSDECWLWRGNQNTNGYGRVSIGGRRKEYAHRIAYKRAHGSLPDGMVVDHICRNLACVRPSHLHAVTRAENNQNLSVRSDSMLGVRGVRWDAKRKKFRVRAQVSGQSHYGGQFDRLEDAQRAARELRAQIMSNSFD